MLGDLAGGLREDAHDPLDNGGLVALLKGPGLEPHRFGLAWP